MARTILNVSPRIVLIAGCTLLAGAAIAAPADTSEMTFEQRLNRLERMLNTQNPAELMFQIERLQREVDTLRGEVDEAKYEIEQLQRQQKDLYIDLDQRLQKMELSPARQAAISPDAGDASSGALGAGMPGGAVPGAGVVTAIPGVGQADGAAPMGVEEPSLDEAGLYQKAFEQLKAGKYQEAQLTFLLFLQTYPNGVYADNAQYWLGEVHYVMRNYEAAIKEFENVINNYPESAKVPDAYLKKGFSHYELKQWQKAERALKRVVERFPSSTAARLAERRIQQMKLEGRL